MKIQRLIHLLEVLHERLDRDPDLVVEIKDAFDGEFKPIINVEAFRKQDKKLVIQLTN